MDKTVSFRTDMKKVKALDALASEQDRDRSYLLNQAIDNYLDLQRCGEDCGQATPQEMTIQWAEDAVRQLTAAHAYVAADNPRAADRLLLQIIQAVKLLGSYPSAGRDGRVANTRELVIANTPYMLLIGSRTKRWFRYWRCCTASGDGRKAFRAIGVAAWSNSAAG